MIMLNRGHRRIAYGGRVSHPGVDVSRCPRIRIIPRALGYLVAAEHALKSAQVTSMLEYRD